MFAELEDIHQIYDRLVKENTNELGENKYFKILIPSLINSAITIHHSFFGFCKTTRGKTLKYIVCQGTGSRRFGGLMVSTLDSARGGFEPWPGHNVVLLGWARDLTLTVPLSAQEYKWVPANCQGNLTKCWG